MFRLKHIYVLTPNVPTPLSSHTPIIQLPLVWTHLMYVSTPLCSNFPHSCVPTSIYVSKSLCFDTRMFWYSYVPKAFLCSDTRSLRHPYAVTTLWSNFTYPYVPTPTNIIMFRNPCAPTPVCFRILMFQHPYVLTPLSFNNIKFPYPYVPTRLSGHLWHLFFPILPHPTFQHPYVPTPLCSETPIFRLFYVSTSIRFDTIALSLSFTPLCFDATIRDIPMLNRMFWSLYVLALLLNSHSSPTPSVQTPLVPTPLRLSNILFRQTYVSPITDLELNRCS